MARPTRSLVSALAETADRLESGASYQWTHMGRCNCGHLARTVTALSHAEIHAMAMEKAGDWSQQAIDYCPGSRLPIDHVIAALLDLGLNRGDLVNLEHLSDPTILKRLPLEIRRLRRNSREDLILYLRQWKQLLEEQLDDQTEMDVKTAPALVDLA